MLVWSDRALSWAIVFTACIDAGQLLRHRSLAGGYVSAVAAA